MHRSLIQGAVSVAMALAMQIALAQTAVPRPDSDQPESRPAPRNAEGRIILGTPPGETMGAWDGFGSRPMIIDYDFVPEGSIVASTPYDQIKDDPNRFDKINLSDVPFQEQPCSDMTPEFQQ